MNTFKQLRSVANGYAYIDWTDDDIKLLDVSKMVNSKDFSGWGKPRAEICQSDLMHTTVGDFLGFTSGLMIVNDRAKSVISEHFCSEVDIYEIQVEDSKDDWYVINPKSVPCADLEKSDIQRTPDGKRIVFVRKLVLDSSKTHGLNIFRCDEFKTHVYYSEFFESIISQHNLKGLYI